MDFTGFLGNPGVKSALSDAFSAGRFPHALILQGEPGTGRRTLARLIAQALVCRSRNKAPCGECPACLRAKAGSHPDIRMVEGKGDSGSISVEQIQEMAADAQRMPDEADYSVYILVFGEYILDAPQNKLLKLLEEPPAGAVFLLVCRSARALLPTIRSRAQVFQLMPPSEEEAARWLEASRDISPGEARRLASLCGGNLGLMQGELESGTAKEAMEAATAMALALPGRGAHNLLCAAAPLLKDRALCRQALARLGLIFRDACMLRCGGKTLLGGAPEAADKLADLPLKQLVRLPELAEEARQNLERNANTNLLVTQLCAGLREAIGRT